MVIVTTTTDIQTAQDPERLLVDFLNTLDIEEGTDVLNSDVDYRAWADERGLAAGDLAEAVQLRDALRAVISSARADLPDVPLTARLAEGKVELSGDTAPREAVAIASTLTSQGRLARVKLCPCDDCGWAFYDRSRNGSRTWCTMAVCGNRVKARTFRSKSD